MSGRQMKKWSSAFLVLALAVTAMGAAQLLAKPRAAGLVPVPDGPPQLVVHEWGTFTTFSGSDGKGLAFTPVGDDLPGFVYESRCFDLLGKGGRHPMLAKVSMETPVLYFYTDRELNASVTVDFPKGYLTEWFPQAQVQHEKNSAGNRGARQLSWKNFKLLPGAYVSLPREQQHDNHYYAARETDAVPLEVAVNPKLYSRAKRAFESDSEYEKFLFYRGVGDFDVPLQVSTGARCGQLFARNTHKAAMAGLFLVRVKNGALSFADLGSLKGGAHVNAPEPKQAPVSDLADAVASVLIKQGLYEREARAMVKTWSNAWFAEEGTRFLYILPTPMADELLPLKVEPKPTFTVRVFVGRHDVLTREREAYLDAANRRLQAAQAEINAAQQSLNSLQLGRFTAPAMAQSGVRLAPPK